MAIRNLEPPTRTRTSKYQYGEDDITSAVEAVRAGSSPGDGPFKSAGQARSAANALVHAISAAGFEDEIGSRVWGDDEKFFFALKQGKRQYYSGDEPATAVETVEEDKPKGRSKS